VTLVAVVVDKTRHAGRYQVPRRPDLFPASIGSEPEIGEHGGLGIETLAIKKRPAQVTGLAGWYSPSGGRRPSRSRCTNPSLAHVMVPVKRR
jgi:hypothetical protein